MVNFTAISAIWERIYPGAISLVVSVAACLLPLAVRADIAEKLANPILSIIAIAVGFIAAALTILLTVPDISSVERFKTVPHLYNRFIYYHWEAILSGMASAIISLAVIVACKKLELWPQILLFHAWLFVTAWAFAGFFRIVNLLRSLLKI